MRYPAIVPLTCLVTLDRIHESVSLLIQVISDELLPWVYSTDRCTIHNVVRGRGSDAFRFGDLV